MTCTGASKTAFQPWKAFMMPSMACVSSSFVTSTDSGSLSDSQYSQNRKLNLENSEEHVPTRKNHVWSNSQKGDAGECKSSTLAKPQGWATQSRSRTLRVCRPSTFDNLLKISVDNELRRRSR